MAFAVTGATVRERERQEGQIFYTVSNKSAVYYSCDRPDNISSFTVLSSFGPWNWKEVSIIRSRLLKLGTSVLQTEVDTTKPLTDL